MSQQVVAAEAAGVLLLVGRPRLGRHLGEDVAEGQRGLVVVEREDFHVADGQPGFGHGASS